MSKLRIVLVDKNDSRRPGIWSAIEPYNVLTREQACLGLEWNNVQWLDEITKQADLLLLHLNDQKKSGEPYYEYLQNANRSPKQPLIVLYSGGGINRRTEGHLDLSVPGQEKPWVFNVDDADRFCIIERPIRFADNLNIIPALRKLVKGEAAEQVCEILTGPDKPLEYLPALSILCQGYLAAHGGGGLEDWENVPEELRKRAVTLDNQRRVSDPSWWLDDVLKQDVDWESKLKREADEMARLRSLPGEAKKVKSFIGILEEGRELNPDSVKSVYQVLRRLLNEA